MIVSAYCFCSAASVHWHPAGSTPCFKKQNKTRTRSEISGSQLGLETDKEQHDHTVWISIQIPLSLRTVGNPSTHLWTLPLPSYENRLPPPPPPLTSSHAPFSLPQWGRGAGTLQPLRAPRDGPSNGDWRSVRVVLGAGFPRLGVTSARRRGGFLWRLENPIGICVAVALVRTTWARSEVFQLACRRGLLGLVLRVTALTLLPASPPGAFSSGPPRSGGGVPEDSAQED